MKEKTKKKRITFVGARINKKPPVVRFFTENGKEVYFKNKKNIPKSIKVDFLTDK